MKDSLRDLKLMELNKAKYSTSEMAKYFNVSQRTVQIWLKNLGLNRDLSKASKISKIKNKKTIKEVPHLKKGFIKMVKAEKVTSFPRIKGDYCLYRFIDKNGKVLYLGKCEKSFHSNGRGGKREYFLKERMQHHYSPSSKHLPKYVYKNTCIIEYASCKNQKELLFLESNMILEYKLKGECMWNGQFANEIDKEYDPSILTWNIYTQSYNLNDLELVAN